MGSDPGRLRGLRPDERFVALALERATGATAVAEDVGGRQGAVDLRLSYPDGRTAAVEVTSHAGPGARRRGPRTGGPGEWPDPRRPWWTAVGTDGDRTAAASLDRLPGAVTRLLTVPSVRRRADKVERVVGVDERHLVVEVGEGGLPERLVAPLATPGTGLPVTDPDVPEGISHIWLTAGWGGSPLVCWHRGHGWSAHATPRLRGSRA
jgi:hypothetical protein